MKEKGSVLMVSLWILALLVLFAVGTGHRASIDLRMSRYYAQRLRANYLARAGVNLAIAVLDKDGLAHTSTGVTYDALSEDWASGLDPTGAKLFENITINPAIQPGAVETFSVRYLYGVDPAGQKEYRCIQDEQSKLNINQLTDPLNRAFFSAVLTEAGVQMSDDLVNLTEAWTNVTVNTKLDPGNIFKHAPFKMPEEWQLVLEYFYSGQAGVNALNKSQEVYNLLKKNITVYGSGSWVNLNTLPSGLLNTYINVTAGLLGVSPTQQLADAILWVRSDPRDNYFTLADILSSSSIERPILDKFTQRGIALDDVSLQVLKASWFPPPDFNSTLVNVTSQDFRIESTGNVNNIQKKVMAVYDRPAKEIVYWHEN